MLEGGNRIIGGGISKNRRFFSLTTSLMLILSTLMIGISIQIPDASAANVNHNVGNVDIGILTDWGRILLPITWDVHGTIQTSADPGTGVGFIGLVVDQDNYNHAPGSEDIADGFDTYPYSGYADFTFVNDITLVTDDGTTQKSVASFKNTGTGTGDPDDILINQTAWTVVNKDWAILQWTLVNLKSVPINNVCIGLELSLSQVGSDINSGVGGDSGDDIDGYDIVNNVYWAQDDAGAGDCIGFGSAIVSDPITHYYSEDYNAPYQNTSNPWDPDPKYYINFYANDTWLYERIHAPNATVGATPGNRTSTVGWNNFTISVGESRTVTLVIAINDTFDSMIKAFKDAQYYYYNVATGFCITEFSDDRSGVIPQKIEVYNVGREPTDLAGNEYFLSLDGGVTQLPGSWSPNSIPTYGYSVFTVTGTPIGPEGDTIGMYKDMGGGKIELIDHVSYGQEGIIPDPLDGESVARWFDTNTATYMDEWLRNASTGPTWGAQNDVGRVKLSHVILNRVMFNPMSAIEEGYVELMYRSHGTLDISNYRIVCDDEFIVPSGTILNSTNKFYVLTQSNYPSNFDLDDGSVNGDNVYLYDSNGNLLDMVGWSSSHNQGEFMSRIPDGSGTYQGYDDATSQAAGWVFNQLPSLMITEFFMDGTSAQIEAYNPRGSDKFLDSIPPRWTFDVESGPLTGNWVPFTIPRGGYSVFTMTGGTPGDEGDTVRLYHNGSIRDEVSYGIKGVAPDPLVGESTARFWDTTIGRYGNDWARAHTSTFGAQNDVPEINSTSFVILNEVMFYPNVATEHFVEVYNRDANRDPSPINISGYKIVCDTEYIIPNGTVLDYDERFFYLLYNMNQSFFDEPDGMTSTGDNVYLYNANGSLVDMVGWNSQHIMGGTVCRVPDGDGTRDGYDDQSSIAAGWRFDCTPTVQLIKVDINVTMREPVLYGHFKTFVVFNMTITNFQSISDIVNIINYTEEGWPVEIFDETGTIKITGITVGPDETMNFKVKVTLPDSIPFAVMDNITILVRSSNSIIIGDSIILTAKVYPFLNLTKTANPNQIYLNGTGHDERTTLTLNLTGMGAAVRRYLDCVFCIDSSKSMYYGPPPGFEPGLGNDPFGLRKIESQNFVREHFKYPDRGAVVDFDSDAFLQPESNPEGDNLSSDYAKIIANIELIDSAGGTIISTGLNLSNEELRWFGDPDHLPIIILITDAQNNDPLDNLKCIREANLSASRGIIIFTIGLAMIPGSPEEQLLEEIANITRGMYFPAPDATHFRYIYENISNYLTDIAVWDNDTFDHLPMVQDVLPSYIDYVPGTFNIPPDRIEPAPGGGWILEWNVSWIKLDETVSITFDIVSKRPGVVETNIYDESRAFYTTWDYSTETVYFPRCEVQVIPPAPLPPKLYIDVRPNKNDIRLYWDESLSSAAHHYLIYAAQNPIGFDFSTPWVDTSVEKDPFDPPASPAIGDRLSWNHTGAAVPSQERWYYCIRTVNDLGEISRTSRTVGKWTKAFSQGVSTFSLPLEPLEVMNRSVDYYLNDMNARYIRWMNPFSHIWMKHGDGVVNDMQLEVGKGYEVSLDSSGKYTFLGMPGAMIRYNTGAFPGFDYDTNAKNLQVISVNPVTGDVTLTWDPVLVGMDDDDYYYFYWATTRDGFDGAEGSDYTLLDIVGYNDPTLATHSGALLLYPQLYYMVIPVNETGAQGASTYSIGVWTASYLEQYDTIGIPLMLANDETADWWCDNIPNTVGINFYDVSAQRWNWHSTRMPSGAYDPVLVMTEGYQISTSQATKFTFIGV